MKQVDDVQGKAIVERETGLDVLHVHGDDLEDPGSSHDDQEAAEDLGVGDRGVVATALLHRLRLRPVGHEVDRGDHEADNVDHPGDDDGQVEVEEGWRLVERAFILLVLLPNETTVDAHVRQNLVLAAHCVHGQRDQGDQKRDSLTKKNLEKDSSCLLVAHGAAVPEALGERVGDVESHGGHPAEEGDPSVLDDVAQRLAQGCVQVELVLAHVQAVVDPGEEEGEEDVEEEPNCEFSKQFRPVLLKEAIYNKGDKEEEGGDVNKNRVERLRLLVVLQFFIRQFRSTHREHRSYAVTNVLTAVFIDRISEMDAEFSLAVICCEVF